MCRNEVKILRNILILPNTIWFTTLELNFLPNSIVSLRNLIYSLQKFHTFFCQIATAKRKYVKNISETYGRLSPEYDSICLRKSGYRDLIENLVYIYDLKESGDISYSIPRQIEPIYVVKLTPRDDNSFRIENSGKDTSVQDVSKTNLGDRSPNQDKIKGSCIDGKSQEDRQHTEHYRQDPRLRKESFTQEKEMTRSKEKLYKHSSKELNEDIHVSDYNPDDLNSFTGRNSGIVEREIHTERGILTVSRNYKESWHRNQNGFERGSYFPQSNRRHEQFSSHKRNSRNDQRHIERHYRSHSPCRKRRRENSNNSVSQRSSNKDDLSKRSKQEESKINDLEYRLPESHVQKSNSKGVNDKSQVHKNEQSPRLKERVCSEGELKEKYHCLVKPVIVKDNNTIKIFYKYIILGRDDTVDSSIECNSSEQTAGFDNDQQTINHDWHQLDNVSVSKDMTSLTSTIEGIFSNENPRSSAAQNKNLVNKEHNICSNSNNECNTNQVEIDSDGTETDSNLLGLQVIKTNGNIQEKILVSQNSTLSDRVTRANSCNFPQGSLLIEMRLLSKAEFSKEALIDYFVNYKHNSSFLKLAKTDEKKYKHKHACNNTNCSAPAAECSYNLCEQSLPGKNIANNHLEIDKLSPRKKSLDSPSCSDQQTWRCDGCNYETVDMEFSDDDICNVQVLNIAFFFNT